MQTTQETARARGELFIAAPVAELLEFAPGRTATGLRVGCLVAPIASWLLLVWHVTVPSTPDP